MRSWVDAVVKILPTRRQRSFGIGLVLCLLALPSLSMAANHYVRAGATGNGSGSDWANAYTDIPSSLVRGDTYYMAAGSYISSGHLFNDAESGSQVITLKTATVADHGTSAGWSDSYAGQVVLHNMIFYTGYYTLDGAYRTGWEGTYGMKIVWDHTINQYHIWLDGRKIISNITVEYVDMPGSGQGTTADGANFVFYAWSGDPGPGGRFSNVTFDHCYIHDIGEGAEFQYNMMTNMLVQYTEVARYTDNSGYHGEAVTDGGPSSNVTYRYNKFIDNQGSGVIVVLTTPDWQWTVQNYYIYGNLFWQQHSGNYLGDGIVACINNQICSNWYIYNNTIVNFPGTQSTNGISWYFSDPSSTNIVVYNNIWYNCTRVNFSTSSSGQITDDYNYYIKDTFTGPYPSGSHDESGSADPFVNLSGGDFHLTSETNDGLHLSSPYDVDPDGVKRGSDNGIWSRGAYQYSPDSASSPAAPSNLTVAGIH